MFHVGSSMDVAAALQYVSGLARKDQIQIKLKHAGIRLSTFSNRFNIQQATMLDYAEHGFILLPEQSICSVRCVYCGVTVAGVVDSVTAGFEHAKWKPDCPFVLGLPVGNLGFDGRLKQVVFPKISAEYERYAGGPLLLNYGKYTRRSVPESPMKYSERLKTFDTFPVSCQIPRKNFAAAGFYYTGSSDEVRCFSCGGSLRRWQNTCDPFYDHQVAFERCIYISAGNFKYQKPISVHEVETLPKDGEFKKDLECRICLSAFSDCVIVPCGHVGTCRVCLLQVQNGMCPICRQRMNGFLPIYIV